MSMEQAKKLAADLGLDGPDDGALLAQEYGMHGQPPAAEAPLRDLDVIESEILFYKRQAGQSIIEIGKRLNEAKAQLSHGEWLPWLREKVDISERSAQDFMRLAREYSKSAEIADLGASKALALLALPVSERERFTAEKHEVDGVEKSVADMTAKELKQAIRERDEARRAEEQARADAQAAEDSRAKMAADMVQLKELQQRAREDADAKAAKLVRVEAELQQLRNKPVDVAIEYRTDPTELAAAREEGLSQARKSSQAILDAKEQELARKLEETRKLREDLKRAREAEKAAVLKLQKAEREAKDARSAAEKSRRAAEVSASPDMQAFKLYFDQAQRNVNEMAEILRKADLDGREKIRRAMTALADAIEKAAGA